MKCAQRNCDNEVNPSPKHPNKKYCTLYCTRREAQLVKNDKALQRLKDEYSPVGLDQIINSSNCKYCKSSNHTEFCCNQHRRMYEEIMLPINNALRR